jgi:hypothetical protein
VIALPSIFRAGPVTGCSVKFIVQGSTERDVAVRGAEVDLDFFAEWPGTTARTSGTMSWNAG